MQYAAAIYDSTGEIIRFVSCPEHLVHEQVNEGEFAFIACPEWATHIINNEPVKVDPPPPPPPTESEIIKALTDAVQRHLDTTARSRNYDGILSLCSYATSLDPIFRAEGQAGVEWRDACWRRCYEVMADVKAGIKPIPTVEELIASLPSIGW